MYLIKGIVLLLLSVSVQSRSIRAFGNVTSEEIVNSNACRYDSMSVSAIIERANENVGKLNSDFTIMHGDIMVYTGLQNADPCTSRGCKWPRSRDGNVYVPYVISIEYSSSERSVIQSGLDSFKKSTCIRFIPRTNQEQYIDIISGSGCFSSVGQRPEKQILSLKKNSCIYYHTVQHELLHALGFKHEQSRSDRDKHVKILFQNVKPEKVKNFKIEDTNNLNTPYDYNSVMHYSRCAFSSDNKPTIIPIPDNNVSIGGAPEMSPNDILRVNRLYCT